MQYTTRLYLDMHRYAFGLYSACTALNSWLSLDHIHHCVHINRITRPNQTVTSLHVSGYVCLPQDCQLVLKLIFCTSRFIDSLQKDSLSCKRKPKDFSYFLWLQIHINQATVIRFCWSLTSCSHPISCPFYIRRRKAIALKVSSSEPLLAKQSKKVSM